MRGRREAGRQGNGDTGKRNSPRLPRSLFPRSRAALPPRPLEAI